MWTLHPLQPGESGPSSGWRSTRVLWTSGFFQAASCSMAESLRRRPPRVRYQGEEKGPPPYAMGPKGGPHYIMGPKGSIISESPWTCLLTAST